MPEVARLAANPSELNHAALLVEQGVAQLERIQHTVQAAMNRTDWQGIAGDSLRAQIAAVQKKIDFARRELLQMAALLRGDPSHLVATLHSPAVAAGSALTNGAPGVASVPGASGGPAPAITVVPGGPGVPPVSGGAAIAPQPRRDDDAIVAGRAALGIHGGLLGTGVPAHEPSGGVAAGPPAA